MTTTTRLTMCHVQEPWALGNVPPTGVFERESQTGPQGVYIFSRCQSLLFSLLMTPREHCLGFHDHGFGEPSAQTCIFPSWTFPLLLLELRSGALVCSKLNHKTPKDPHYSPSNNIPRIYFLNGRRDFADVIKFKTLICRDYLSGFNEAMGYS